MNFLDHETIQKIANAQKNKLEKIIQRIIDSELDNIRKESEEWGLGEMDELHEIESIDKIKIDRIESDKVLQVYVNIYINYPRYEFDNTIYEIENRLEDWFPNIEVILNEIIDERTSGPGIDW